MTVTPAVAFDNSYARLPGTMHVSVSPTPVEAPRLIAVNAALAAELGLDPALLTADVGVGNALLEGMTPIAQAYAGHQFGNFVPQLGDGRAILMGEVIDLHGRRRDIQLKGAGPTPFSRRGDGRAALGPVLREYLVSESMHALGIPTTRALMAATTGERVYREQVLPGAVLTRVAASHIRVGTFQFFAVRRDLDSLRLLADHVIARHYPALAGAANPYLALLDSVMQAQASLVARWVQAGFIHGVMNTDNTSVSGETIDYGPCAFMDAYDPATVFSSIDQGGRYAYDNQAPIAQWNLARLAETLLPLIDADRDAAIRIATERIEGFPAIYTQQWLAGFSKISSSCTCSSICADSFFSASTSIRIMARRMMSAAEPCSRALIAARSLKARIEGLLALMSGRRIVTLAAKNRFDIAMLAAEVALSSRPYRRGCRESVRNTS
jgi:uncharacterized protein YdiU (UPF0061 family)